MDFVKGIDPKCGSDESIFIERARALRPFYFIVVCWGDLYTKFLFNFCVAALLSPGNIPALHNRGKNKFLIATTDEDWRSMQAFSMFNLLKDYVDVVFVRIPPCPEDVSGCIHMGIGHKLTTQMAYEANAYSVLLTPDLMVSDGTMAAVQRHAVNGIQVVLTAALRFAEEPLFSEFRKLGIVNSDALLSGEGLPLTVTGRQLVQAGIESFHSETLRYEWGTPYFSTFPVACWWRLPRKSGIIVHSLSWAPLLVDYAAVKQHDSSMLDNWTIDGDYIFKNFGSSSLVHVVQDSDEVMLVSWAPLKDREQSLSPRMFYRVPILGSLLRSMVFYTTFNSPVFDPLKKSIFFLPVYWHTEDIDVSWAAYSSKIIGLLNSSLFISSNIEKYKNSRYHRISMQCKRSLFNLARRFVNLARIAFDIWRERNRISKVAMRAFRGDQVAIMRVKRRISQVLHETFGLRN